MNLKKKFAITLTSILFFLTACGKISIPTNANTAFRNFTLCFFQQEVASNTINLHYSLQEPAKYGIVEFPITLGSYDMSEVATLMLPSFAPSRKPASSTNSHCSENVNG